MRPLHSSYERHLANFETQFSRRHIALERPRAARPKPDAVVVVGMGGSGLAGDILAELAPRIKLPVPIVVWKSYGIPVLPFRRPLIIAVSFSGNTSETRSAFREAGRRGCARAVVAGGGALLDEARHADVPAARFSSPENLTPRVGIGYTYSALIELLALWFPELNRRTPAGLMPATQALQMGRKLVQKFGSGPIIVVTPPHLAPVGILWKAVLNETGKRLAFAERAPEVCHNTIMGFTDHPVSSVVTLRDGTESLAMRRALDTFGALVGKKPARTIAASIPGNTQATRLWNGILLGHYVAYLLAVRSKKNPQETPLIAALKRKIR